MFGALVAVFEGELFSTGFYFMVTTVCGLGNPLTPWSPSTVRPGGLGSQYSQQSARRQSRQQRARGREDDSQPVRARVIHRIHYGCTSVGGCNSGVTARGVAGQVHASVMVVNIGVASQGLIGVIIGLPPHPSPTTCVSHDVCVFPRAATACVHRHSANRPLLVGQLQQPAFPISALANKYRGLFSGVSCGIVPLVDLVDKFDRYFGDDVEEVPRARGGSASAIWLPFAAHAHASARVTLAPLFSQVDAETGGAAREGTPRAVTFARVSPEREFASSTCPQNGHFPAILLALLGTGRADIRLHPLF